MMYPDDSLQSLILPDEWWIKTGGTSIERGALVIAFAPHVDQIPYTFQPVGRTEPTAHDTATVRVAPLKVSQPLQQLDLPVAAMTLHDREVWAAYRSKKRPCVVFSSETAHVQKGLTRGKPNHSTAQTFLAAPFYGVDQGKRAGYSPEFVERVRHLEYPQFHWDKLPGQSSTEESILRLDHLQPFGNKYDSYSHTGYKLSEEAMNLLDEQLQWLIWGGVPEDSMIITYRELIELSFDC